MLLELGTPAFQIAPLEIKAFTCLQKEAKEDPLKFAEEYMGFKPWLKASDSKGYDQFDIMESVKGKYGRISAIATCHKTGKSSGVAVMHIVEYVANWPDIVICSMGAGFKQTADVYWGEFHQWENRLNQSTEGLIRRVMGTPLKNEWRHPKFTWSYMTALSPESGAHGQGRPAPLMYLFLDEATGAEERQFDTIEGLRSAGNVYVTYACNPLDRDTPFYRKVWSPGLAHQISMNAWDHPNIRLSLKPEDKGFMRGMISLEYVEQMQEEYALESPTGRYEDHPMYQARILGQWPQSGKGGVIIPYQWISDARNRELPLGGKRQAGIDVARYGEDSSVLWIREGDVTLAIFKWHGLATDAVVSAITEKLTEYDVKDAVVDIGYNQGVADGLRTLGFNVMEFAFGSSPQDKDAFRYKIDEAAWQLRERFQKGCIAFAPEVHSAYIDIFAEDCQRTYSLTAGGMNKKAIEPKDAFKKRNHGKSPDIFDAGCMAYYEGLEVGNAFTVKW